MTQLQDQSQLTDNFTTLTAGASTISLRGLGANRNLVLLDGYRAVPVNATMAVDVNSIPAAAIQRVEVITGGASSVYGADAVAGVVNFILKKDFEGVDVDLQTGAMQNGEGAETRASVLFGVNSSDGRGNIMVGIELAKRDPIHADDTDFYHNALRDGTVEGTELIYTGPYYTINGANAPNGARHRRHLQSEAGRHRAAQRTPGRSPGTRLLERRRHALYGRRDLQRHRARGHRPACRARIATTARPTRRGPMPMSRATTRSARSTRKARSQQHLLGFEANIPLDRDSVFGRAEYEVTDGITAYAQILSVQSKTRRIFTESPAIGGWGMVAPLRHRRSTRRR